MNLSELMRFFCVISALLFASFYSNGQGIITTWIGDGTPGYSGDNGPATAARIRHPYGIAYDAAGNFYIADQGNYVIRKVNAFTDVITTVAGNGIMGYAGDNGMALNAELGVLYGICLDAADNIYLTDGTSGVVRMVNSTTGRITTVAGNGTQGSAGDNGPATNAQLNQPEGVCVYGSYLYITDAAESRIRRVDLSTGIITTVVGDGTFSYTGDGGPASVATLNGPSAICADAHGNIYIADEGNLVIRKITAATGLISTIVGTGIYGFSGNGGLATNATIGFIQGICIDAQENIYITDASCSCRKVSSYSGIISIVAGSDTVDGYGGDGGSAILGLLNNPTGICVDPVSGTMTIADYSNMRIRKATQPGYATEATTIYPALKPSIYPNPSQGKLCVKVPGDNGNAVIDLYNLAGEKVYSSVLKEALTYLDIPGLPGGNYIVSIRSSAGEYTQKITINK